VIASGADGAWIATNRHVVRCRTGGEGSSLEVLTASGDRSPGEIRWLAPDGIDLALVHAGPLRDVEVIPLRRHSARVGDSVFVVGNPLGLAATYTAGIVSALRTTDSSGRGVRVLQVQASVNPGNSGGGLYDRAGDLLGVVTWSTEKRIGEGIGFAISVADLLDLIEKDERLSKVLSQKGSR